MNIRTPRIVDRLRRQAALSYVGREAELDLVRQAMRQDPPPFSVLLVHGPGGIGKTAFTERLRALADEAGMASLRIDARDLGGATPESLLGALALALGLETKPGASLQKMLAEVLAAWAPQPRRLLIIDTCELLGPLEAWLRDKLLAELPEPSLVVLAGRQAPSGFWLSDPVWSSGVKVIGLRNLTLADCEGLLAGRRIADPRLGEATLRLTHGHPLAVTLLADVIQARGTVPDSLDVDLIRQLTDRLVSHVPSALHRAALEVCACARATTQDLLAHMVDNAQAAELFEWLSGLGFIEAGPLGLFPHDLVRDAVLAELKWRHHSRVLELSSRLRDHYVRRLAHAPVSSSNATAQDILFLQRHSIVMRRFIDFSSVGAAAFDSPREGEIEAIAELASAQLGPESESIARRWHGHPAARFWVARDGVGRLVGATFFVDLTALGDADLSADAGLRHAADWVASNAPARPGEKVLCAPFLVAEGGLHAPSAAMNTLQMCMVFHWMTTPSLALFIITVDDPVFWAPMMHYIGFHRIATPPFSMDQHQAGHFAHDWRVVPPDRWLQSLTARSQGTDSGGAEGSGEAASHAAMPPVVVMSQSLFERAVKEALKQIGDLSQLAANPLARSRLVQSMQQPGESADQALRRLLHDAVKALGQHPRHLKFQRAIELTYLQPLGSQELVAERLGLAFSTYRYQLGIGIERVAAWLWRQETTASPL